MNGTVVETEVMGDTQENPRTHSENLDVGRRVRSDRIVCADADLVYVHSPPRGAGSSAELVRLECTESCKKRPVVE